MYIKRLHIRKRLPRQRGFSLIEVLVSLSIFAIVVTMAVGTLIVLIDANTKAQAIQTAVNNVSYVLDGMVRDVRTGYAYECESNSGSLNFSSNASNDCPSGYSNFAFTETGGSLTGSSGSHRIGYRLNNGVIERQIESAGWQAMTSSDVDITILDFVLVGTDNSSDQAPTVTIYLEGQVTDTAGKVNTFNLQTTITQQSLDV